MSVFPTPPKPPVLLAEATLENGDTLELWRYERGNLSLLQFSAPGPNTESQALVYVDVFAQGEETKARAAFEARVMYDVHDPAEGAKQS